jgi:hypothetical protein
MITTELLNNNEMLAGLTDEQKTAVVELSKHDEGIVIGDRIGKVYGDLDADILAASGMAKEGTEKTYAYAKRVIGELKGKAESAQELQSKVDVLTAEKAKLEKALQDGSADTETKKALAQAKTDLTNITTKYTELAAEFENSKSAHEKELFGLRVAMELEGAAKGVKFKSSIPDNVAKVVVTDIVERIKKQADTIEDEGKKVLVFKGEDGAVLRDSSLKPLTATDLLLTELEKVGITDKRRQQTGTGSAQQEGVDVNVISLAGVKTQVEADTAIHKMLVQQGLVRGSKAYQDQYDKAWKDNAINKLPTK